MIRNGEQMKITVLAVIGLKEVELNCLSLRSRREGDLGSVSVDQLLVAAISANRDRQAGLGLSRPAS
jgi:threonyl-tRNA synthetase